MEVERHLLPTWALDVSGQVHIVSTSLRMNAPPKHIASEAGWAPVIDLKTVEKRKISCFYRKSIPESSIA
jgi:hypothetical protein